MSGGHLRSSDAPAHVCPVLSWQCSRAGISPCEVERTREGTEEYVVWEKRRRRTGLCNYSDYYVGRPAHRATTQSYKETVFELRPEQITVRAPEAACLACVGFPVALSCGP